MKAVKKKSELSEKEEIDAYFSDAKKKSFPIGIIFIMILLIIIGGCAYYYFVIDSPQNIFKTFINDKVSKLENITSSENINYDFFLETNIDTTNKEYIDIVDIINRISLKGDLTLDYNQNKNLLQLNPYYQKEDLLTIDTTIEGSNAYIKLNNIYDKVIKIDLSNSESETKENTSSSITLEETKKLISSLKNIITDSLTNGKYNKEYTDLNDIKVKKITLNIDEDFMNYFYDKLLENNDFMEIYSKLESITKSELEEKINKEKSKLDNSVEKISIYLSILKNEFIMFENIYKEDRITLTKENNEYIYKIYNKSIIKCQGNISITGENNNYQISLEHDDIEENLSIELDLGLILELDKEVEWLDISNSVNYEELSEAETNKITEKLLENENIKSLYQEIISLIISNMITDMYLETTP